MRSTLLSLPLLGLATACLSACSVSGPSSSDAGPRDANASSDAAYCARSFHGSCLELVVPRAEAPNELTHDSDHLYFTFANGYEIRRISKTTRAIDRVATVDRMITEMIVADDHLYFATAPTSAMNDAIVGRAPLAGGSYETLVPGLANNARLAVDGGYVYFTQWAGELARVPIVGGAKEHLADATFPGWIGARDGQMYWIDSVWHGDTSTWSGRLAHATPNFSFAENLETVAVTVPAALDATHVYWYDHFGGGVYRTPIVKGATEALGSIAPDMVTRSYRLGLSASYVYFLTNFDTLARMPRDGGSVEDVMTSDFFLDLDVDDAGAYVSIGNVGVYYVPDAL